MEQNFQTSFIPKKPVVVQHAAPTRSVSIFTVLAFFVLLTVLLVTGGLYLYKASLATNLKKMQSDLNLARSRFEPSKIAELQLLDRRLRASTEILSHHIAITPVFSALEAITMKTVRYTKFSYAFEDKKDTRSLGAAGATGVEAATGGKVIIKMSGQAVGYRSVALQSDLFSTKEEGKNFIDPVFSNLSLDDKGNVLFDLEFAVDPAFVDYKQMLKTAS